ncbi:MAG: DUF3090 family protein [Actinobacteria bacterium]|nr:DUF3090 family protein [Actinomycetota bacterium]MCL5445411.1 DUF3090 family protein [Actinomycetota bacterium]
MTTNYDFDRPDKFVVDAIGPVGNRLFVVQCVQESRTITLKLEKSQIAIFAGYVARIVHERGRPGRLPENVTLDMASDPDWVVGTLGVSYDEDEDRLVVLAEERTVDDGEGRVARFALTVEQAAAFAIRATQLVEAGRPPCPLCGYPLDPSGHDCPRTNGHRPPVT